jgi:LEA14-like dessication related protein
MHRRARALQPKPMIASRWLGLALLAGVAGCSSMLPRLQPPTVTLASLHMAEVSADGLAVTVLLELDNPNPQDIKVDALDFAVLVGGVSVATAQSDRPTFIPANGSGGAAITARADFSTWASALQKLRGKPSFDYEIVGTARINGRALPFSRRGEMRSNGLLGSLP